MLESGKGCGWAGTAFHLQNIKELQHLTQSQEDHSFCPPHLPHLHFYPQVELLRESRVKLARRAPGATRGACSSLPPDAFVKAEVVVKEEEGRYSAEEAECVK